MTSALGDLLLVRGLSVCLLARSSSFLCLPLRLHLLSVLVLSCPGAEKTDPSYPPLVGSPSLPTPSRIGRMAIRQEGGGGDSFFCPLGLVIAKPYSCRGLALVCSCSCVIRLFKPYFCSLFVFLCLSYVLCIGSGLLLLQDPCLFFMKE